MVQDFYREWLRRGTTKPRAALMFGRYMEEPAETKNPGAIRAVVHAFYEPPQELVTGGVRLLTDPEEKAVTHIAKLMNLEPVGWIVTTEARPGGAKYMGKVFMSGAEVIQAAKLQNKYRDKSGHSRFVTVILEHGENIEPVAYQVSDQCVAMERDGVIAKAADPFMLTNRKPPRGEMPHTVVYEDRPIDPGFEFLPDKFIVKVIVSVANQAKANATDLTKDLNHAMRPSFLHHSFPSRGKDDQLRLHLSQYHREEYVRKFSDFNLLCALPSIIGMPLTESICKYVKEKKSLDSQLRDAVDRSLISKNLF